jgi:hypothetical protein
MYAGAVVFTVGVDAVTFGKLGYNYFPNWTFGVLLLILVPVAVVMSVLSVIVSSRANDVRSANSFGIFIFLPFLAIYFASEIRLISLDLNGLLTVASVLSAVDIALYFVSKAGFHERKY